MSRKEQITEETEATPTSTVVIEEQKQQKRQQRLIYPVHEGHRSQQTAAKYKMNFEHFLNYIRIHDLDVLLDIGREALPRRSRVKRGGWSLRVGGTAC